MNIYNLHQKMLSKVTTRFVARQVAKQARCFGAPSGKKADNGLAPTLVEQAKEHGAHEPHTHPADLDHKFIAAGSNKKTIVFDNL